MAGKVAAIWIEHGALAYQEYVGDTAKLEGTRSFSEVTTSSEDEVIIFGWVTFESKEVRDLANEKVALDPRMPSVMKPLTDATEVIFDATKMVYGGFRSLVQSDG